MSLEIQSLSIILILPIACIIDFLIGDPRFLPHPVRWIGRAIEWAEPEFRKLKCNLETSGLLFAICLIGIVFTSAWAIIRIADMIHPLIGVVLRIILIFYCISIRSLEKAAMDVYRRLAEKDISSARRALSMIVGRETAVLDEEGIVRASVETVSENFVDGVASPVFFAVIGGAPLALAYKAANTLDSMIGYRNDAYLEFGRASALIDDVLNFIPARLSVPVIALAAFFPAGRSLPALVTGFREGRNHASPNAGYPEAAFAGALAVKLGGPNRYHGKKVVKPYIGTAFPGPGLRHIKQACDLMILSSVIWIAFAVAAAVMFSG